MTQAALQGGVALDAMRNRGAATTVRSDFSLTSNVWINLPSVRANSPLVECGRANPTSAAYCPMFSVKTGGPKNDISVVTGAFIDAKDRMARPDIKAIAPIAAKTAAVTSLAIDVQRRVSPSKGIPQFFPEERTGFQKRNRAYLDLFNDETEARQENRATTLAILVLEAPLCLSLLGSTTWQLARTVRRMAEKI